MSDSSYHDDLSIDIDQLDVEWVKQPRKYMKYSEALANKELDVRRLKAHIDILRAELYSDIVSKHEKKPTEAMIESAIVTNSEMVKQTEELNKLIHQAEILKGAVRAFEQRKTALENEVKLWQGGYFAGPKEPRQLDGMSINDLSDDNARERQRKSLNSKRGG